MSKGSSGKGDKPHWLWQLLTGQSGYKAPDFFAFLKLHYRTKRLAEKVIKEMKRDGFL